MEVRLPLRLYAESTNTKNELKRILKPAFKSAIIATILSVIYSLFLSAPLTGEKGSWKMTFGDLSFNLYDDADFLYGWMSFSGSKVRWATVDEGIMSPHTGSYKCTGSEKTYKLRVKEDGEIFYKVLLTFDGTEGGPNTYLKFRDKKGTSGVMESDSWDGVSADPAINNTYSDNSTSNKDIYYTEDDNEYTVEYDPDVPEEYDFSLDPNTETYSDTSLPNMAVRYFDFLTRGYKAEMYRENMMSPDVAGKSTKDVGMYYCDLDGDDNEELIICDMSQLEHVYAVYGIAQIAVLFDPGFCQDRGWLCGDESFLRERIDILHDRIFCTANSFSDRGVAGPALVGAGVFKTAEVGVDRDLTCAQPQRKNFVRQCKIIFTGKLIHGVSSCSSGRKS